MDGLRKECAYRKEQDRALIVARFDTKPDRRAGGLQFVLQLQR
jgi:hypothetical protein